MLSANITNLHPEAYYGLTLGLGGAELTMRELITLYAMLNNAGIYHQLRSKQNIKLDKGKRLLSPEACFLVLNILKETPYPINFANVVNKALPVAWKTGTSSGYRDAWSIGILGDYVIAVWVGNFNNHGNQAFIGREIAAPLLLQLITALQNDPPIVLQKSSAFSANGKNLIKTDICKASGRLPTNNCIDTTKGWFIPGKSPINIDNVYREVAIDNKTGLRACHFNNNTHFSIF